MGSDDATTSAGLRAGQEIGGFVLDERLHESQSSTLWRVSKRGNGPHPPLVMKLPHDDDSVAFEVEQMILPTLAGVHVPRFIARGSTPRPFLVMEEVAGTSLQAIDRTAPIGYEQVADIGARVAAALHAVHRQRVVHLNLTPESILLRESGEAVLVEFGCARHECLPDLLDDGTDAPSGNAARLPPEQARGARCDLRSDLFALGVLLYRLCTGTLPFDDTLEARGLHRHRYRDIIAPRALRPDCPPWLQEAILRCLEANPDRRPASGAQLAFDLRHAQQMPLTWRAHLLARSSGLAHAREWLAAQMARPAKAHSASEQLARCPIVLAVVDLAGAQAQALEALCRTTQMLLENKRGARLACLAVLVTDGLHIDELIDADGTSKAVRLQVQLRQWARPLVKALEGEVPGQGGRVTLHVLEARDAAAAIFDFARRNLVDHVVLSTASRATTQRALDGVAVRLIAESPCSVTLVRAA